MLKSFEDGGGGGKRDVLPVCAAFVIVRTTESTCSLHAMRPPKGYLGYSRATLEHG